MEWVAGMLVNGCGQGAWKRGVAVGVGWVKKSFFYVAYKKTGNEKCRPVDWVAGMFVNGCGQGCVEKQCGSGVGEVGKINVA